MIFFISITYLYLYSVHYLNKYLISTGNDLYLPTYLHMAFMVVGESFPYCETGHFEHSATILYPTAADRIHAEDESPKRAGIGK